MERIRIKKKNEDRKQDERKRMGKDQESLNTHT